MALPYLTNSQASVDIANYWTPTFKASAPYYSERGYLLRDLQRTIKSGSIEGIGTVDVHLYAVQNFNLNEESSKDTQHLSLISYGSQQLNTVRRFLIERLGLTGQPEKYVIEDYTLTFMYQGLKITIWDYSTKSVLPYSNSRDATSSALYLGYGGFGKVTNVILGNHIEGYSLTPAGFSYTFKDLEGNFVKEYPLGSAPASVHLLGLADYGSEGVHNGFQSLNLLIRWFMKSRTVGYSSFFVNKNFEYVGPREYLEIPLFNNIVNKLIEVRENTGGLWEYRESPSSLKETVSKNEIKCWEQMGMGAQYKEVLSQRGLFLQNAVLSRKYNTETVMNLFGVESQHVPKIKLDFERHLARKIDVEFFLLSSSEETICDALQEYRDHVQKVSVA